ncbi:MFS transporter [Williamsia phyllosphaerae]|uniref:Permease of the major facilitator superfamily protein n=1 Tax=Williamsia phyllosphaerae TaxID=885042 RepID=A0ABQ1V0S0_9NOCA|nr:MFS transporter [Williamsia phyllosphaerae]GGF31927.1 putative permease of the major facilitator superfamily protein [Williamsia phyllosphaerae]
MATALNTHPDSSCAAVARTRRVAILALALGGFGIGTTEFVSMGLLPNIAGSLDISEPTAGHVISAYALGVVVGAPLIAAATARMSRRTLLIALMVAFVIGNAATVFAPTYGTLMAARFVAGLPHGAYFGVAALVAAHLAGAGSRAKAVGQVMMGLSVANVVGVPAATWLGDSLGWRTAFGVVVVIGLLTIAALIRYLPTLTGMTMTNPMTELGALARPQVWFTLLIGIVGFGGMFAFYTYIHTTLTDVSGLPGGLVPIALMLFGIGMVVGNIVGGALADRNVVGTLVAGLVSIVVALLVFVAVAGNVWTALVLVFVVGVTGSALVPALQTRLMDVADDAQTLAAALNHSALNVANAGGAWLGGLVIAGGFGYRAPSVLGAGLGVAGLVMLAVAVLAQRRTTGKANSVAADIDTPMAVH